MSWKEIVFFAGVIPGALAILHLQLPAHPGVLNLAVGAVLAWPLATALLLRRRPRDLPFPRDRSLVWLATGGLAFLAVAPTLALPYLSDDYAHLERMRDTPTPFHAFFEKAPFWRPFPSMFWWVFARISPESGFLAHLLMTALFVASAILLVPALRRCGAPRGIAVAAGMIWATSPVLADVVAWPSNSNGLLSITCALGALATLPMGRGGMAIPTILAALALLSREDSMVLPVLLLAAGARFRIRNAPRWFVRTLPISILAAAALALRLWVFRGDLGYGGAFAGGVVSRWWATASAAFTTEPLVSYVEPVRLYGESRGAWARALLQILPPAILCAGVLSPAAWRCLPRAAFIVGIGLIPVLHLFPIGPESEGARFLTLSTVGIALALAAAAGGLRAASARARWSIVAVLLVGQAAAARWNFRAWAMSGDAIERRIAEIGPILERQPQRSRIMVYGLPDSFFGALCFRNGVPFAFQIRARRPDLEILQPYATFGDGGAFDALVVGADVRTLEPDDSMPVVANERLHLDLREGSPAREQCRLVDGRVVPAAGGLLGLDGGSSFGSLLLPPFRATPGAKLRIDVEGDLWQLPPLVPRPVFAIYREGTGFRRVLADPAAPLTLPTNADVVQLEILLAPGRPVFLGSVDVTPVP